MDKPKKYTIIGTEHQSYISMTTHFVFYKCDKYNMRVLYHPDTVFLLPNELSLIESGYVPGLYVKNLLQFCTKPRCIIVQNHFDKPFFMLFCSSNMGSP